MSDEVDLNKAPEGQFVQAKDGQFFFIPNADVKRFAVPKDSLKVAEKLWSGSGTTKPGGAEPNDYCGSLLNYLLTHDPQEESWRKLSVKWINFC